MLRKLYPDHSLVMTNDWNLNILSFPGAYSVPLDPGELITNLFYAPFARRIGGIPGVLLNSVTFGGFRTAWDVSWFCKHILCPSNDPLDHQKFEFIVYVAKVIL